MQILTGLRACDECGKNVERLMMLETDYTFEGSKVCPACLKAALEALEEGEKP